MSVSVTMPQLGESVTEGTVTRWLKKEGERVEADEPLLEVSTDKVDTEIPSPASGILTAIRVAEDETVEVGAELAVIDEGGSGAAAERRPRASRPEQAPAAPEAPSSRPSRSREPSRPSSRAARARAAGRPAGRPQQAPQPAPAAPPPQQAPRRSTAPARRSPRRWRSRPPRASAAAAGRAQPAPPRRSRPTRARTATTGGAYVTPLVRKLAAEHDVDLAGITRHRGRRPDPQAGRAGGGPVAAAGAAAGRAGARHQQRPDRPGSRPGRGRGAAAGRAVPAARPHREDVPAARRSSPSGWSSRCRPARS